MNKTATSIERLLGVQSLFRFKVSEILVHSSISVLDSTVWTSVSIVRAHVVWSVGDDKGLVFRTMTLMNSTNQRLSFPFVSTHADPPLSATLHHLFCYVERRWTAQMRRMRHIIRTKPVHIEQFRPRSVHSEPRTHCECRPGFAVGGFSIQRRRRGIHGALPTV